MNPAICLLRLQQGNRATEAYVEDFCRLSHRVDFKDVGLNYIFEVGLNEPICSQLPGGKNHWSLAECIDYAVMLSVSPFTVGIMEDVVLHKPEPAHILSWPRSPSLNSLPVLSVLELPVCPVHHCSTGNGRTHLMCQVVNSCFSHVSCVLIGSLT